MIATQRIQHISSASLALLVHALLLLGLMAGVSWNVPPHLPIEAEIWSDMPLPPLPVEASPPQAEFAPLPDSLPKPVPEPAPTPSPAPAPAPTPAPVMPNQAEIALEMAKKKRAEELQAEAQRLKETQLAEKLATEKAATDKAAAEKVRAEKILAEQKLAEERREEEVRRSEAVRLENQRIELERVEREKQEHSRRLIDQELARQMREDLDSENRQIRNLQNVTRANQQARVVKDFQERIRNKIKDALVMPRNLKGDAGVTMQVSLLPNGEVLRVTLVKSSGQPMYDSAVERAIFKASPLPLPTERELAAKFREGLKLEFRPSDDNVGLQ
jgi:colicin import membrane protein